MHRVKKMHFSLAVWQVGEVAEHFSVAGRIRISFRTSPNKLALNLEGTSRAPSLGLARRWPVPLYNEILGRACVIRAWDPEWTRAARLGMRTAHGAGERWGVGFCCVQP